MHPDEIRQEVENMEMQFIETLHQAADYLKQLAGLCEDIKTLSVAEKTTAKMLYEALEAYFRAIAAGMEKTLPLTRRKEDL